MLVLKGKITIIQQPSEVYPNRNQSYTINSWHSVNVVNSWANLADTATVVIPQKLYYKDKFDNAYTVNGKNIYGGDNQPPFLMRGDKIIIELGYNYFDSRKVERVQETPQRFSGFITDIQNKRPITVTCMDNMYLLQQRQFKSKLYKAGEGNLQKMLNENLQGTGFKVNVDAKTNIGDFMADNETVAEVLARLRKWGLESYFIGNTLYCSGLVYRPEQAKIHRFRFQYNIISDDLIYSRKDDEKIGVKIISFSEIVTGSNKDGTQKKSKKKIQKFAFYEKGKLQIKSSKPESWQGEIRTLNVVAYTEAQIEQQVKENINRVIFDGYKGKFTTFGLPCVKQGDICEIQNPILPEQDGKYYVKTVTTTCSMSGLRQEIEIDLKVS